MLLFWVPVSVAAIIADLLLLPQTPFAGLPSALVPLLGLLAVTMVPSRRYQRLAYALHPTLLRVVRGWLFHTDTIVPLVRVQHIDVTRGPLGVGPGSGSVPGSGSGPGSGFVPPLPALPIT